MIIRAGGEIRRLLELLLKVDDSFLLQLTVTLLLLKRLKRKDSGALWEVRLVFGSAKGEALWERWEARLAWKMLEAKGAV